MRVYGRWRTTACERDNGSVKTLSLAVNPNALDSPEAASALDHAALILRHGGLVALPTETVYGLGANALDPAAVQRIFAAKQRPRWDPVIVHITSLEMLAPLVSEIPARARRLIEAFWPGPLTLLLPRSAAIPDAVTAGRPLVGVRMPAHPVALELIRRAGIPVAAPSANRFGHASPTSAAHVLEDLNGRIDAVLDAGPALHGLESTVLDPTLDPMVVYRPGAVTLEQIRATAGPAILHQPAILCDTPPEALPSPGVGLRHYAPRARLLLVESPAGELAARLAEAAEGLAGERLGVMLPEGFPAPAEADVLFDWGRWNAPEELAQRLYSALRSLDQAGCTVILCPLPGPDGIGAALRDRLRKAAVPSGK